MKLIVTKKAFYGNRIVNEGEIVSDYKGEKAPSWGKIIKDEAPVDAELIEETSKVEKGFTTEGEFVSAEAEVEAPADVPVDAPKNSRNKK
jgi:hypothetical protein